MNEYNESKILEKLNQEQLLPVKTTEGPVLVLAGAGSGKTRVLTSRIAYLIEEKGIYPSSILAITFTNKAAKEMQERLSAMTDTKGMWVCTIHSMCVRILRDCAEQCGFTKNFSIYSETERSNIIKQAFAECDYDDEKLLKKIKYHIGNAKMLGLSPVEYAKEYQGEENIDDIIKVYARYDSHLKKNNALDFDDLLSEARRLLVSNAEVREYYGGKFKYILVDEFQDTNAVQMEIIRQLASVHQNLFAVGDDDQSIYGWRGAKIENILNFQKYYPQANVFKLEQNYRSTKTILSLANTVIQNNKRRKGKELWTENAKGEDAVLYESDEESGEALFTVKTIAKLVAQGYHYSDFAVLMRVNALTRSYEQEFTKYGINYKVFGGFRFFERKEIKDILAYLRVLNNPFDDEAVLRIINVPKRGVGGRTIEVLNQYALENDLSVYDALLDVNSLSLTSTMKEKLKVFASLIKDFIIRSQETPVDTLVKELIAETGIREMYADNSDESISKKANIDEYQNSVDEFIRLNPQMTLSDYLNQVTLSSDTDSMDESDYVTLATIHAVKGLEFRQVFLCGLENNIMPTSRAMESTSDMEEERRLMYVAITRAREKIYFTRSRSRYLYGQRQPTSKSIFLKELSPVLGVSKEEVPTYKQYSGDFSDNYGGYGNRGYGGGYSYGNKSGYNSGYESSSIRRTSYAQYKQSEEGYTTFGANKKSATTNEKSPMFKTANQTSTLPSKDFSKFAIGVKVKHPKFGAGYIQSIRGENENMILNILFDGLGVKQLSANLAPITVVEE